MDKLIVLIAIISLIFYYRWSLQKVSVDGTKNSCQQCREAHSKPPLSEINYLVDPCLLQCSSIPCCPACPSGSFCKPCAAGSKPC